jgi:hypothetical protein
VTLPPASRSQDASDHAGWSVTILPKKAFGEETIGYDDSIYA